MYVCMSELSARQLYTVILRALASDNYNYILYTGLLTYNRFPTPNLT